MSARDVFLVQSPLRSLRTAAWYQYRPFLTNLEINRRSPVPSIQVNERGCAGGGKRAPWAAAVTTREPKQRVWRAVAAEEVQAVMRAAALFPANLHFAVKEIAEIAGGSGLPQICANVAIQLGELLRIGLLLLDFVVHHRPLARFEQTTPGPSGIFQLHVTELRSHQRNFLEADVLESHALRPLENHRFEPDFRRKSFRALRR